VGGQVIRQADLLVGLEIVAVAAHVFAQKDADHYDRIARVQTAQGARTGLFVPEWGELFVAVPRRGDQSAEIVVHGVQ
jgi:hypothetical protein